MYWYFVSVMTWRGLARFMDLVTSAVLVLLMPDLQWACQFTRSESFSIVIYQLIILANFMKVQEDF